MRSNTKRIIFCVLLVVIGLLANAFGGILIFSLVGQYVGAYIVANLFPAAGYIIATSGFIFFLFPGITESLSKLNPSNQVNSLQEEVNEIIKQRLVADPTKIPVWVLMQTKLEGYFDRNLNQITYIFWLSVVVMIVGFGFILFGISQTFVALPSQSGVATHTVIQTVSSNITPAIVGSVAGIITEFIGVTFLFIYRSTIRQASTYMRVLERINTIGMGMNILESISTTSQELQDKTKAEIVKQILLESEGTKETIL
ncbi:MAG TPA: hypothetical protein VN207_13185 [Ktedonobacteraceae bacterium]|nr:hypothetical protein [Ktedonobacteraceae bacterium]